jgi:hypothetical protein
LSVCESNDTLPRAPFTVWYVPKPRISTDKGFRHSTTQLSQKDTVDNAAKTIRNFLFLFL